MGKIVTIQTAFNQGQWGPTMDGRVDVELYAQACKRLENFVIRPQGGAQTRSGTKFIANTKNNGAAKLIPFVISNVDAFIIEVGNGYMRFYKAGAQLSGIDGPELMANRGFETGDYTGWTQGTDASISGSNPHSGFFASTMSGFVGTKEGADSDKISIDISKTYKAQGWYLVQDSVETATYNVRIRFYDSSDVLISEPALVTVNPNGSGSWLQYSKTIGPGQDIEFPANTAKVSFRDDITGLKLVQFDDVSFTETNTFVEIISPYITADLFELDYAQTHNVMYFAHPDHTPRKLSRISDDEWILHEVNFDTLPLIDDRFTIDDPTSISQVVTPAAFEAGKTAILGDTDNTNFAFIDGDIGRILFAGQRKAQILWAAGGAPTQLVLGKIIDPFITDDTTFTAGELSIIGTPFGEINPSAATAVGTIITLPSSQNGNTAFGLAGSWVASGTGDQYYHNASIAEPDELAWHGDFLKKNTAGLGAGLGIAEWGYGDVDTLGFNTVYVRIPLDIDPTLLVNTQDENAIARVIGTGSLAQLFRKEDEGKFILINDGIVEITTFQDATSVRGRIVKELEDATATFDWLLFSPYWKSGDQPGAVVFHENRLVYGGSPSFPSFFWGSAVNQYESFTPGLNDGDSYAFALQARRGTQIRWLESRDVMVAGTDDSEWIIGTREGIVTPTSIFVRRQTANGNTTVQPVVAENSIVFVEKGKKKVREINFDFETDAYLAPDLTLLSENIAGTGIKDIAAQNRPWPTIWAVTNDGDLLGMTFIKSQGIVAWHRHLTGATTLGVSDGSDNFESVAVIPSSTNPEEDEVWVVVNRTINGATKRFVELLDPPLAITDSNTAARQLDSYVVDTDLNQTVTGLEHLEGDVVTAIIDGDPDKIETAVVASGQISLSEAPTVNAVVGLPFKPVLQTMRTNVPGPLGTSQAQTKRIGDIYFRLYNALGLKCGPAEDNVDPLNGVNDGTAPSGALANGLFIGDIEFQDYKGGYNTDGFIFIVQEDPLPATVSMIAYEVDTTGGGE